MDPDFRDKLSRLIQDDLMSLDYVPHSRLDYAEVLERVVKTQLGGVGRGQPARDRRLVGQFAEEDRKGTRG